MPAKGDWIEQVGERTRNGKKHVDSLGPQHFAVDVTIGSVHYWKDEQWKEIDNIFESAVVPWDWQMLKAGYHIRVKEDFTAGQIIEFEKQGKTVQFQPMALEWTNDLDQIQPIAMPHEVAPVITNPEVDLLPAVGVLSHQGTIRWDNGYGQGVDFEWRCTSTRLVKILEIENLNKLPIPEQYIIDGGNPVLRLNLIFDPSDVDIYVDGGVWDKKAKRQTFSVIEFRKGSEILWGFMPLRYWGSNLEAEDNQGQSVATLEKRGNKLYISIRVPYEWLQSAVYPVFIDVDVDEQVGASTDDCYTFETSIRLDRDYITVDSATGGRIMHGYFRFTTVNVPQGSTIDHAYIDVKSYTNYSGNSSLRIVGIKETDTATFSTQANADGRAMTTAFVDWVAGNWVTNTWYGRTNDPQDINTEIEEVVGQGGWVANNALAVKIYATSQSIARQAFSYDYSGNISGANLHIEYSIPVAIPRYPAVNFQDPAIV